MLKPIVLIIDPALQKPCNEAINCISKIMGELKKSPQFVFTHFEYVSPYLNNINLENFIRDKEVGAVICLGSVANVTDQLPFVDELSKFLEKNIFNKNIPFFGICFSHQMFAAMHGFKVDFLKNAHKIKFRKHHQFRKIQIIHPKLGLLSTSFNSQDYFSDNKIDLEFKKIINDTKNWTKEQWDVLLTTRDWVLTPQENRIKEFIKNNTYEDIISHARHEQEVWNRNSFFVPEVVCAGESQDCAYEALVHSCKPIFTVQTHPETAHEEGGGYLLLKNFIYMAALLYAYQ